MGTKHRSWWQNKSKTLVIAGIIILIALIYAGYQFNWTGFPNKTLWDWLQLVGALAIPVVVGFGAVWFTRLQQQRDQQLSDLRVKSEREAAEKHAETEREIAEDNQCEAALQAYIDKMSELLLEKHDAISKVVY